jgi:hypothetical protein
MNAQHVPADLESIRTELARLRRDARTVCATTINFIVFIDDAERRDWVMERATMIADKHPSRMIVLDTTGVEDGATVETFAGDGHGTIKSERVTLSCRGMSADELRAIAHALTITDLPTILWWTAEETVGNPRFDKLIEIAADVVVDSSGSTRDDGAILGLCAFVERTRRGLALRDLAWMRLSPWHDMVAQFFDDAALREELFCIRSLKIVSGSSAEALYLAGWLGSRLGWKACGHDEFCDREGTPIKFSLVRDGGMRRVQTVAITTTNSTYIAEVTSDPGVVRLTVEGKKERPERLAPLQAIDNASLIERAILERQTDKIFETALRMVGAILA